MRVKKHMLWGLLSSVIMISFLTGIMLIEAKATSIPVYHKIPPYQQKEFYETETVKIQGIPVEEVTNSTVSPVITQRIDRPVKFVVFNSTKQEIEQELTSQNGVLKDFDLIKNHNYIIFAEDVEYRMPNIYIWVKDNQIVNIKDVEAANYTYDYPEVTSFRLYKRTTPIEDPKADSRVTVELPVCYGEDKEYNLDFKLVSDVETISGNTGSDGKLKAKLLEDVTYIILIESDEYSVEPFPIAVKDKSEYAAGKYTYDHSDCHKVEEIQLVKKEDVHKNDTAVTSLSGNTVITGANFKDILVIDKELDKEMVKDLKGKEYDVIDIKTINPHRWEISKYASGEYQVTRTLREKGVAANVYLLNQDEQLRKLDFKQAGNKVNFTVDSLSLYPVVIEYSPVKETPAAPNTKVGKVTISGISKNIAAGKKIKLTADVSPVNADNKAIVWTTSNKKYATVDSNGKVTVKKAGAGKTVKIIASAHDGSGKKAVYKIKIMKDTVKSIRLKATKQKVKAGKKIIIKATVKTTGKKVNKTLKWASSNTKYATVTSKGRVTAKRAGKGKTVKITAQATDGSGKKKTIKIKIK